MRRIMYIPAAVLICAGMNSCILDTRESVYGNGNVVSEEREIGDFNQLKVSSGIDVYIKQGSAVSLRLEADENLLDAIRTELVDQTLRIYSDKIIRKAGSRKVYLEYRELNRIDVNSSGDIRGENTLNTDELEINLRSAGDLRLEVRAGEIECDISSAGDARVYAEEELTARSSSAGSIYYKGNTQLVDARTTSSGSIVRRD